jgi:transcription initiation factor TFIIF subunit beta
MLLRSDLAQHQNVPKEYELQITSEAVQNTFVFTEQDLPGFKSRSKIKFDPATANMPARLNRARVEKPSEKKPWEKKKFEPFYRRAIPSKSRQLC